MLPNIYKFTTTLNKILSILNYVWLPAFAFILVHYLLYNDTMKAV